MLARLKQRAAALTQSLTAVHWPLLRRARRRTKVNHDRAVAAEHRARWLTEQAVAAEDAGHKAESQSLRARAHRQEQRAARFHRRAHKWADRVRVLAARIAGVRGVLAEVNEKIDALPKGLAATAVKELVGTHEEPPGSNWGGMVERMIRFTGYTYPVYWCGCFACWALVKIRGAEIPNRIRMGYAPYITADAQAGRNGLRAVPVTEAKRWDLGCLWGGKHIVLVRGNPKDGMVPTWEGNSTAPGKAGSASNGGEVTENWRPISDFDAGIVARATSL